MSTSVRITSAPETPERAVQPQNKTTKPSEIEKKDPESRLFHFNYFARLRHPLEAQFNPTPERPSGLTATTDGQEHRRVSHLRSGCTKPGQNLPHVDQFGLPLRPLLVPQQPLDLDDVSVGRADRGSAIAPTGLWCPDGSRPTFRAPPPPLPPRYQPRSLPCGQRLRSEGTNNAQRRIHLERSAFGPAGRVTKEMI